MVRVSNCLQLDVFDVKTVEKMSISKEGFWVRGCSEWVYRAWQSSSRLVVWESLTLVLSHFTPSHLYRQFTPTCDWQELIQTHRLGWHKWAMNGHTMGRMALDLFLMTHTLVHYTWNGHPNETHNTVIAASNVPFNKRTTFVVRWCAFYSTFACYAHQRVVLKWT